VVAPQAVDPVLDDNMYPSGRWIVNLEKQLSETQISKIKSVGNGSGLSSSYAHDILDYKLASKFGINSSTVLVYDVPLTAGAEELEYIFEDYALERAGVRKLASSDQRQEGYTSSGSFLVNFSSRIEAERALFEMNGSTFAGSQLHMYLYS
jgi:hypothetical protein